MTAITALAAFIAIYAIFSFLEAMLYVRYDAKLAAEFMEKNKDEILTIVATNLSRELYKFITKDLEISFIEEEGNDSKTQIPKTRKKDY